MPIGAALVSAGASLLGGAMNSIFGSKENKRNRQFQMDMLRAQQAYNDKVNQQQMDFQREVNQKNFEWNDPKNVRARLEAAGYNPYLYNNPAQGSAMGASLGAGTSSLGNGSLYNPGESLGNGIAGTIPSFYEALTAKEQAKGLDLQNRGAAYNLDRTIANDQLMGSNGMSAYYAEGQRKLIDIEEARNQANISGVQSTLSKLGEIFANSPAVDENGAPIVDENGQQVSNFDATKQAELDNVRLQVTKLLSDIDLTKGNFDLVKVEKEIKQYTKDKILPAQLSEILTQVEELHSRIGSNNAAAQASLAGAALSLANRDTVNGLRRYQVGQASWDNQRAKWDAKQAYSDYYGKQNENAFMHDYVQSWHGGLYRVLSPWLSSLGGASIGAAAAGYGLSRARRLPHFKK